jgi:hypothetical protein
MRVGVSSFLSALPDFETPDWGRVMPCLRPAFGSFPGKLNYGAMLLLCLANVANYDTAHTLTAVCEDLLIQLQLEN